MKIINEYISRDEVTLSKYLQMSEDEKSYWLPFEYYYHISDFFNEYHEFYDVDGLEDFVEEYEDEEYDMVSELETRFPKVFTDFGYWLYDKIETFALGIPDAEYPTWAHMDFTRLVKNTWLIHFTNNADEIASSGFKRGVDDHTKLGLTTQMGEYDKKFGGYNFAYDATTNYGRYIGSNSSPKYGSEAVLFRASGIEVWHHGDEEPQVIFYGNTARDIIPISGGEEYRWAVKNIKTGGDLYGSDSIEEVTDWVIKNHSQYRKVLHETAKRTKIILNERLYKLLCENEYKGLKNLVGYNIARYETRLSNSLAELSKFLETLFTKNTDINLSNEAGSLYLNSASGNKVPLENLTHILNAIADGYVKTKEEVYKISTILPRALEDGSNFRQTIVDILSKSFEDKNGVDNKKFSGDIVSRYHVPFNKVFDKLKSLNEKTKNLEFNPLNLQVIDKQTHAGREILEIKDDGANIIVLMYKSTGKGDPELKKKGEWIAIPAFSDYNRVKNWFVKSKASVMWSKGENQYLTQLSQFLNRNYNQFKNLFEVKKTEEEKQKRNARFLRKIIITESQYKQLLKEGDSWEDKLLRMYMSLDKTNVELAFMYDNAGVFKNFAAMLPSKFSASTKERFKERYEDFIEETKTKVFISNAGLQEFPKLLLNYPYIKAISFYNNKIKQIPKDIAKLENLEELNFSSNYLKELPSSFANLDNLENLDLFDNDFDVFPEEITKLKKLVKLDLTMNNIKEVPDSIANLANTLKSLRIGGNNFGGKENEEALENRLEQLLPNTLINLE